MQGIFEKNIEQKLNSFSIEPSAQIWAEVEKALHPPRKKRGLLWWWVPLAGIIMFGIFVWKYNNKHWNETSVENTIANNTQNKTAIIHPQKDSTVAIQSAKEKTASNFNALVIPKNKIQEQNKTSNNIWIDNKNISEKKTTTIDNAESKKNIIEESKAVVAAAQNNNATFIIDSTQKTATAFVKQDSVAKQKDSLENNISFHQLKKIKAPTQQWYFVVDAGSLTINDFTLLPSIYAPNYSNAVTAGGGSSQSSTLYTINSKTGFHFTTGVRYRKEMSTKWNFEVGLQHHYFQNKQATGIRVDSIAGSSNYYYKTGTTNEITNHAFAIEVPLSVNYVLNPKSKNKFYLQGGVSLDWLFAKKWLITDNQLNAYYYQPSLIKNFQMNASIGMGIHFANDIQFIVKVDQGISSFYTFNNKTNYKQQISAQLLFPLHLSSKKKSKK